MADEQKPDKPKKPEKRVVSRKSKAPPRIQAMVGGKLVLLTKAEEVDPKKWAFPRAKVTTTARAGGVSIPLVKGKKVRVPRTSLPDLKATRCI